MTTGSPLKPVHQQQQHHQPLNVMQANNGSPLATGLQQSPAAIPGDHLLHQSSPTSSAEVMMTLNRLNAPEEDQLDFDVETEVTTG